MPSSILGLIQRLDLGFESLQLDAVEVFRSARKQALSSSCVSLRVILAVILATCCSTRLCRADTQNTFAGFDEYAIAALADWNTPGMAVAVVQDGQLVFARGYGFRKLGTRDPVDPETIFPIASVTKTMNATALAMLVDEGQLKWDDAVVQHLADIFTAARTRSLRQHNLLPPGLAFS